MEVRGGWVLEVDIRKFFDTLDHGHLREFLQRRVRDGVLLRLIGKWLNAGVMEDGSVSYPDAGTPQGGVISPLLANVYLHYVLDTWFEQEVQPRLECRALLIRYADDFVIVFSESRRPTGDGCPAEAIRQVRSDAPSDKTRLMPFRPPSPGRRAAKGAMRASWDVRPAGLYPLLGSISARLLDRQTEDGLRPIQPSGAEHRLVVPG